MAGQIGQGAQLLGQALIPETMANLQRPSMIEQAKREQQVGNIQAGRLFSGMNQEIGTPQTKSYQVNGKTIGQDNASTVQPLFSGAKKMAMFSQAFLEQARAMMTQQRQSQIALTPFTKDDFIPTDAGLYNVRTGKLDSTTAKQPEGIKVGTTRDVMRGSSIVTEERQADGTWKQIGSGPRWEGPKDPVKPFGYDEDQAAKRKKEERESADAERKARADEYSFQSTDEGFSEIMRMAAKIGTNKNLASYTGKFDAMTPDVSDGATQFTNDLKVLKSNLAMNALNAAKAGSASGATGFGALSEGELAILQNQIATLDPSVGKENFQKQVVDIIRRTKGMQTRLRATRPQDAPAPSTASAIPGFSIQRIE